jgi:hypothetical protein
MIEIDGYGCGDNNDSHGDGYGVGDGSQKGYGCGTFDDWNYFSKCGFRDGDGCGDGNSKAHGGDFGHDKSEFGSDPSIG